MTDTATAAPIGRISGTPLYTAGTAPAHLLTKDGLRGRRLKPAPGQAPAAYVRVRHYKTLAALYDPAAAVPTPPRRIGDAWAYRDAHTCRRCGEVKGYTIDGKQCGDCQRKDQAKAGAVYYRTCRRCRAVRPKRLKRLLCKPCLLAQRRELAAERAKRIERAQWCAGRERYGCKVRHASKRQVEQHLASGNSYFPVRFCAACEQRRQAEMAQARQEAAEAERRHVQERLDEVAALEQWARDVLADRDTVILDTETTGLDDGARIVDIAVITATGDTLLDTLVNPGEPIPAEATNIHGITDVMVTDAPTFADIADELRRILAGRRVVIYNAVYDTGVLIHELGGDNSVFDRIGALKALLPATYEDAMEPYSDWYGEWSDWHGNYRWQRLGGGHRAHGDCLAVIDCLKAMTRPSVYEQEDEDV